MAGKRTTFRAEFKKQLVELYLQEQHEKTLAQVARENGVGVETLRVWVKKHRAANPGLPEIFRTRLLGFFRLLLVIPGEMRGPRWESCTPDPSGACVDYRTIRSTGQ